MVTRTDSAPPLCSYSLFQRTSRLYDRRGSGAEPLLEMGGHAHTVWQARHNPFHDELLASCSSDASVSLWYAPSVVAAAAAAVPAASSGGRSEGGAPRGEQGKTLADCRAAVCKDHEESVYGACDGSYGNFDVALNV